MQIQLHEGDDELPIDRQAWTSLLANSDVRTVFQSYEWFDTWRRTRPPEERLFFLTLRDASGWVGFAPLMITRGPGRKRELQFAGSQNADYLDFVLVRRHEEALVAIGRFLREHRHRWDEIYLRNVPSHSRHFGLLQPAFERAGLFPDMDSTIACPALIIRGCEQDVRELIGKYSLRRKVSALEKRGRVQFLPENDAAAIEAHLEDFFDQHVARWKGTASPSLFLRPERRTFYRELARSLSGSGVLNFCRLELDGRPVAYHFGFRYDDKLIWYKPAFDPAYADLSPGLVLIRCLIDYALQSGCIELDFTIGEEPFKERFTNRRRANANIRVFRSGGAYLLGLFKRRLRHWRRVGLHWWRGRRGRHA